MLIFVGVASWVCGGGRGVAALLGSVSGGAVMCAVARAVGLVVVLVVSLVGVLAMRLVVRAWSDACGQRSGGIVCKACIGCFMLMGAYTYCTISFLT